MPERRFPGLRGLLPLLLAACLIAWSAEAATPSPSAFVVAGVPVDATAQNAVAARDAAQLQGQRLAFRRLLERLTQQSDWSRLPSPGDDSITNLVQDFDVSDEHNSGVRYLASYTFRFKAASVRALLRQANIAESELASKLVVVLPVLVTSQGPRPWNDDNPWHAAWAATSGRGGLVPWTVPAGDAADAAFDPANPAPAQLAALSARYGGGDIVVATATQNGGADQAGLDISISRYGPAGDATTTTTSVPPGKPDQSLYQAGVLAGQRELEEQWKKLSFSAGGTEFERARSVDPDHRQPRLGYDRGAAFQGADDPEHGDRADEP